MRAVRFADECSKWTTPAQTFSSSGALFWARTQTRFAAIVSVRRGAASGPRSPVDEWRSEQYESSFLGREALPRCRQRLPTQSSPPKPDSN